MKTILPERCVIYSKLKLTNSRKRKDEDDPNPKCCVPWTNIICDSSS